MAGEQGMVSAPTQQNGYAGGNLNTGVVGSPTRYSDIMNGISPVGGKGGQGDPLAGNAGYVPTNYQSTLSSQQAATNTSLLGAQPGSAGWGNDAGLAPSAPSTSGYYTGGNNAIFHDPNNYAPVSDQSTYGGSGLSNDGYGSYGDVGSGGSVSDAMGASDSLGNSMDGFGDGLGDAGMGGGGSGGK
jgi:hypothetical protein